MKASILIGVDESGELQIYSDRSDGVAVLHIVDTTSFTNGTHEARIELGVENQWILAKLIFDHLGLWHPMKTEGTQQMSLTKIMSQTTFDYWYGSTHQIQHLPTVFDPDTGGQRATCGCDYDQVDVRCIQPKSIQPKTEGTQHMTDTPDTPDNPDTPDTGWLSRLRLEKTQLGERLAKLDMFITSDPAFGELPQIEQLALREQHHYMTQYFAVLTGRLDRAGVS